MSDGFDRAQSAYDRALPPDDATGALEDRYDAYLAECGDEVEAMSFGDWVADMLESEWEDAEERRADERREDEWLER